MNSPILHIARARPAPDPSLPLLGPVELTLAPGDLALIRAADPAMSRALARLCAGLPALAEGHVRLLGQDFAGMPRRDAEALRGRIGLAPAEGGWLPHLPIAESMLLARLHHGDTDRAALVSAAEALSRHFGLDGIPGVSPHELSRLDLARAACARAFLGTPALLFFESPLDAESADALVAPLRDRLVPALRDGAASIWVTRSPRAWDDPSFPTTSRLDLSEQGLMPA